MFSPSLLLADFWTKGGFHPSATVPGTGALLYETNKFLALERRDLVVGTPVSPGPLSLSIPFFLLQLLSERSLSMLCVLGMLSQFCMRFLLVVTGLMCFVASSCSDEPLLIKCCLRVMLWGPLSGQETRSRNP